MTRFARLTVLCASSLTVLALGACRRPAPVPDAPVIPAINQDSINRVRDSVEAANARRRAEQMRQDSIAAANALAARQQQEMMATIGNVVYFEYDDAGISAESRALLDAKVPILLANPSLTVRVAGHTDERGSDEYNLALGQRRAVAVKDYLTARGVGATRIEAISYGEEQPAAQGAMESAWSQNRRAEFQVTSPAAQLVWPRQ